MLARKLSCSRSGFRQAAFLSAFVLGLFIFVSHQNVYAQPDISECEAVLKMRFHDEIQKNIKTSISDFFKSVFDENEVLAKEKNGDIDWHSIIGIPSTVSIDSDKKIKWNEEVARLYRKYRKQESLKITDIKIEIYENLIKEDVQIAAIAAWESCVKENIRAWENYEIRIENSEKDHVRISFNQDPQKKERIISYIESSAHLVKTKSGINVNQMPQNGKNFMIFQRKDLNPSQGYVNITFAYPSGEYASDYYIPIPEFDSICPKCNESPCICHEICSFCNKNPCACDRRIFLSILKIAQGRSDMDNAHRAYTVTVEAKYSTDEEIQTAVIYKGYLLDGGSKRMPLPSNAKNIEITANVETPFREVVHTAGKGWPKDDYVKVSVDLKVEWPRISEPDIYQINVEAGCGGVVSIHGDRGRQKLIGNSVPRKLVDPRG